MSDHLSFSGVIKLKDQIIRAIDSLEDDEDSLRIVVDEIVNILDNYDEDDFFGTEGWREV
jgi:hypothetical protein